MYLDRDLFLIFACLEQYQNRKIFIKNFYNLHGTLNTFFESNPDSESEKTQALKNEFFKTDLSKIKNTLKRKSISFLAFSDDQYPKKLKEIGDPPLCLFYKGNLELLSNKKSVAIVGTRTATNYGINITKKIASLFVESDIVVVSGLATGIDSYAHIGAVSSGKTIAVLGTGLDVVYPISNKDLYKEILNKGGLIVSEYPPSTDSWPWNFPQRNRLISALSNVVIVVEGDLQSGALITARFAIKQGKLLFALPGPINSCMSNGPNILIKSGVAELFTSVGDVLEKLCDGKQKKLSLNTTDKHTDSLSEKQKEVYNFISYDSCSYDDLQNKTGLGLQELTTNLSILELKGFIEKTFDGGYLKKE